MSIPFESVRRAHLIVCDIFRFEIFLVVLGYIKCEITFVWIRVINVQPGYGVRGPLWQAFKVIVQCPQIVNTDPADLLLILVIDEVLDTMRQTC